MRGRNRNTPWIAASYFHWFDDFLGKPTMYTCKVGDSTWFLWLDDEGHTTFYWDNLPLEFTARREKRRNKYVWYGFKTANERTYKVYIGPSGKITLEKLRNAGEKLYQKI